MKSKIEPQLLIAIGVLIASFSALFVYMKQASIMNEQTEILLRQSKANAWPHIDIGLTTSSRNDTITEFQIKVTNKGTGPAIISNVRIRFKETAVASWQELFEVAEKPASIPISMSASSLSNSVLSPNEEVIMFQPSNPELIQWFYKKAGNISLEICYNSVFEDTWIVARQGLGGMELSTISPAKDCAELGSKLFVN